MPHGHPHAGARRRVRRDDRAGFLHPRPSERCRFPPVPFPRHARLSAWGNGVRPLPYQRTVAGRQPCHGGHRPRQRKALRHFPAWHALSGSPSAQQVEKTPDAEPGAPPGPGAGRLHPRDMPPGNETLPRPRASQPHGRHSQSRGRPRFSRGAEPPQ